MSWNYRVVRTHTPATGETHLGIHEVYYDDNGRPRSVTVNPAGVSADDPEGLRWVLARMAEACDKPVLDFDQIGGDNDDPEA